MSRARARRPRQATGSALDSLVHNLLIATFSFATLVALYGGYRNLRKARNSTGEWLAFLLFIVATACMVTTIRGVMGWPIDPH